MTPVHFWLCILGGAAVLATTDAVNCYECTSGGPTPNVDCATGVCNGASCWMQIVQEGAQFSVSKYCGDSNTYATAGLTSGNDSCSISNPPGASGPAVFCLCNANDQCTDSGQLLKFTAYRTYTKTNLSPIGLPPPNGPPPRGGSAAGIPPGLGGNTINTGGNQSGPVLFPPPGDDIRNTPNGGNTNNNLGGPSPQPVPGPFGNGGSGGPQQPIPQRPIPPQPRGGSGTGGGANSGPPPVIISGGSDTAVGQPPSPIPVNRGGFGQPTNMTDMSGHRPDGGSGAGFPPPQTNGQPPSRPLTTRGPAAFNTTAASLVDVSTKPSGNGQQRITCHGDLASVLLLVSVFFANVVLR